MFRLSTFWDFQREWKEVSDWNIYLPDERSYLTLNIVRRSNFPDRLVDHYPMIKLTVNSPLKSKTTPVRIWLLRLTVMVIVKPSPYTPASAYSIRDTKDRWKWYCSEPWLSPADKMDAQISSKKRPGNWRRAAAQWIAHPWWERQITGNFRPCLIGKWNDSASNAFADHCSPPLRNRKQK